MPLSSENTEMVRQPIRSESALWGTCIDNLRIPPCGGSAILPRAESAPVAPPRYRLRNRLAGEIVAMH